MSIGKDVSGGLLALPRESQNDSILYHYCSTSTFQQIVSNGTIRLSALTLSNDSLEGKLVSAVIKRLANLDELDKSSVDLLIGRVEVLESCFDGLGLCLSKDGDLLSQWRGYADDAYGFSIGFSTEYLNWLGNSLLERGQESFASHKVLYRDNEHEELLRPSYVEMKKWANAVGSTPNKLAQLLLGSTSSTKEETAARKQAEDKLGEAILKLFGKWFLLKSYAFREEQEVRLISYLIYGSESEKVSYRATRSTIVPYREFPLIERERMPIKRVILGPRHRTPLRDVENCLKIFGFGNVEVVKSAASYR